MLEYDFNELDNDFITIWSKYIIYPTSCAPKGLEELAKLGQINAMQSVLLFDDKHLNSVGDLKIHMKSNLEYLENKSYEPSFNEELIMYHAMHRIRYTNNECLLFHNLVRDNLSKSEHIKYVLTKHKSTYLNSNNPLILQRYYEIKKGHSKLVSKLNIKKLRMQLRELYYKDTNNSAVAFAYAKNLCFFGNKEEKNIGRNILYNLSLRQFSASLQEELKKQEEAKLKKRESFVKRMAELDKIDTAEYVEFVKDLIDINDEKEKDTNDVVQLSMFDNE